MEKSFLLTSFFVDALITHSALMKEIRKNNSGFKWLDLFSLLALKKIYKKNWDDYLILSIHFLYDSYGLYLFYKNHLIE